MHACRRVGDMACRHSCTHWKNACDHTWHEDVHACTLAYLHTYYSAMAPACLCGQHVNARFTAVCSKLKAKVEHLCCVWWAHCARINGYAGIPAEACLCAWMAYACIAPFQAYTNVTFGGRQMLVYMHGEFSADACRRTLHPVWCLPLTAL